MRLTFQAAKAAQVAAAFLHHSGGQMTVLKLVKLVYIVDREALGRWGRPVTYDSFASLPHGPVPSQTYDNIKAAPGSETSWDAIVKEPAPKRMVRVSGDLGSSLLAPIEEALIREVWDDFGGLSASHLRGITHGFPEWKDPGGSSLPISYRDVLLAKGYDPDEADDVLRELEAVQAADDLFC